jgi:signal transduction histidine kinase
MLHPKVLDLNLLVANMEKMLKRIVREDIELVTTYAPEVAAVQADPGQLEMVIMNLVINARDAMPQGGRLTLEVARVTLDENFCPWDPEVRSGTYVILAISDTGVGMAEETLARAFEPFFTTKELGKGTGLGLATVHGIVKQSGGHIRLTSQPGQGTSMRI